MCVELYVLSLITNHINTLTDSEREKKIPRPSMGAEYCDQFVCVYVCLCVRVCVCP